MGSRQTEGRRASPEGAPGAASRAAASPTIGEPGNQQMQRAIREARGSGEPVDGGLKSRAESSFDVDLSGVRVHTGHAGTKLAGATRATALTHGRDIFFGDGQYRPGTAGGDQLIAHELAHVAQQGSAPAEPQRLSSRGESHESQADEAARRMLAGQPAAITSAPPGVVHRKEQKPADGLSALSAPLTKGELDGISGSLVEGYALAESLTQNAATNAVALARQIAGSRGGLEHPEWELLPPSEPHMAKLIAMVAATKPVDAMAPLVAPLTASEMYQIRNSLAIGTTIGTTLGDDPEANADALARQIAFERGGMAHPEWELLPPSEPHLARLITRVKETGPMTQKEMAAEWSHVSPDDRSIYAMQKIMSYGYSDEAAAGIVGNLWQESQLIPPKLQGAYDDAAPLRQVGAGGKQTDYTAMDVYHTFMKDKTPDKAVPGWTGIGLPQHSTSEGRKGMFEHEYQGHSGVTNLFSMDAQIDYLITQLKTVKDPDLISAEKTLTRPGVTYTEATDAYLKVEKPGLKARDARVSQAKAALEAYRRPVKP